MEKITGILDWPERAREGRIRQLNGAIVESVSDPFVPAALSDRYPLRNGQELTVEFQIKPPGRSKSSRNRRRRRNKNNQRHQNHDNQSNSKPRPIVENILAIDGIIPAEYAERRIFDDLISIDPQPRMTLEYPGCPPSNRLIDLFCPIGYGTRGLIVSPPKAGKTTLLQEICHGLKHNHPEVEVIALLIDERPEEVTDFNRNVPCLCLASSNDQDVDTHISLSILAIERAKRLVEAGKDVVVVLDSLTRMGRAFNASRKYAGSGRTMTGGLDSRALEMPKRLFGAARNGEDAGSLTIIASCLVDTGSRADQIIFEEFKGTGNMELILNRDLSEKRLYPAINLAASGTRKEHLLLSEKELETVTALRRRLINMQPDQQIEQLLAALKRFSTNAELVGS